MDSAILAAINEAVQHSDTLWILGDFAFRGRDPSHYRERINCRDVRLLLGNHDKRSKCEAAGFAHVGDVAEISVGKQRVWMSHYPHRSWPASHKGSWHLYGHTHGSLDAEDRSRQTNSLDVGVDNGRFSPWSFDDIARLFRCPSRARKID
jgi:calcineurin-like phosphoesterase family protein